MSPDDKRHGTHAGYQAHHRDGEKACTPCANALTRWRKHYELRALNAGGRTKVPTTHVRAHIEDLTRYMTVESVSVISGVSGKAVHDALSGKWPTMRRATADRILAVKTTDLPPGNRWITATGTARRIQALRAIGWSLQQICVELGTSPTNSRIKLIGSGGARRVTVDMHARVKATYERLWDQPPHAKTPQDKAALAASVQRAAARGWVPPLAWDDETIDDPNATPDLGAEVTRPHGGTGIPVDVLVENITWLLRHDGALTAGELAARFGYADRSAIQNALARHGHRDLLDRLNRNQERAA